MRILGADFSSAPTARKPIRFAIGELAADELRLSSFFDVTDWAALAKLLAQPGAWVLALDFPFGFPRKFLLDFGIGEDWNALVDWLSCRTFEEALKQILAHKARQPAGQRDLRRRNDFLAHSASPLNFVNPAVGKMLLRGLPILAEADVSIVPVRLRLGRPAVIEGYPALVARQMIGRDKYKSGELDMAFSNRSRMIGTLREGVSAYGLRVSAPPAMWERAQAERGGDALDSILCAVQAAWASGQPGFGMAEDADVVEGWIADPKTFISTNPAASRSSEL